MNLNKKRIVIVTAWLISLLIVATFVYVVFAQTASTFWITEGIYPLGSITISKSGSTYYAKNGYGQQPSWGENSNVTKLCEDAQISLPEVLAGTPPLYAGSIIFTEGKFSFDSSLHWKQTVSLIGQGKENTILEFTSSSGDGLVIDPTLYGVNIENLMITNTRGSSVGNALFLNETHYSRFLNIEIRGKWENGIYCYGAIGNDFEFIEVQGRGITDNNVLNGVVIEDSLIYGANANNFYSVVVRGCDISVHIISGWKNVFNSGEYGYAGYPSIRAESQGFLLESGAKYTRVESVWLEHIYCGFNISSGAEWNYFKFCILFDISWNIANSGTGSLFIWNNGFVNRNNGVTSVTGAVNTVVVTHGLSGSPTNGFPQVTARQGGQDDFWVSARTTTNFTISFDNQPAGSTWYFDWYAET